ncbi:MAG: DUF5615 family PIN-like protein [Acidobacteriota bacterium]
MAERIGFHLDEHIHPAIAKALRQHGINVTTTVEAGLRTRDDVSHLSYAQRTGRVIVTHDDDFLRLTRDVTDHPGIAYCHKDARSLGEIIASLRLIYEALEPEDMVGHVEFL